MSNLLPWEELAEWQALTLETFFDLANTWDKSGLISG